MPWEVRTLDKLTIRSINGPVVKASSNDEANLREMVLVGDNNLIGELISIDEDESTIQVYEETDGLKIGESISPMGRPLSVLLGPGMMKNIFDGIERPLQQIREKHGSFIPEGIGLVSLDHECKWTCKICIKKGDKLGGGDVIATVKETELITHKSMVPPDLSGEVLECVGDGDYTIDDVIAVIVDENGEKHELKLAHYWPVRTPRPVNVRLPISKLLKTGQRVIDTFFPIAKGGACAIPGGFGTGKTMTQHQLAKYCDADIIIYIGCGERGNEMTEVLEDFPKLIDPNTGKPLMERTILIANTSNMPVAAREASVYTGITMAEYYRDMGYHVAMMADSTSRWAEALREISGRLEEMPAEEGYPAYLPTRLAEFYERAGYVKNLNGTEGSVTVIGAVSPAGGDFSEPVTENTKRFVNVFLGLDKELAYSRHYPAINWLTGYSQYPDVLRSSFELELGVDLMAYRQKYLKLLYDESKLQEVAMLVGEDVLPEDQRWVLDICRLIKIGFLQQNAFNDIDTYVPLEKQAKMLLLIDKLYESGKRALAQGIPLSKIRNNDIFSKITSMKYDVPNDNLSKLTDIGNIIRDYFVKLMGEEGVESN